MLDKGVPSTFANLKHLYTDSSKLEALGALAHEYYEAKKSAGDAKSDDPFKGEGAALYYLAQHYNYHLSRDLTKAMEFVNKGIEKAPENVEFQMTKARIIKHTGNTQKASEAMDQARNLDLKDRYINTKAAKYQLRNNETEKALETVGLFTRNDSPAGPLSDLLDMQCVWFMTEDGEAQARKGNVGLALKRFHTVYNIFDVWQEDQFDFHSFSLRKGQIRAYVDMVRWEDHVRDHPFYSRAALGAVKLYLDMYDGKALTDGANGDDKNGDAAERKKAAKKARKAEREAAEKAAKQDPNKAKAPVDETKKKDDDPDGLKLAATSEPLVEATKFLVHLLTYTPKNLEAQLAGFEVYMRRGMCHSLAGTFHNDLTLPTEKYVLALGCLNAALTLDASHPTVHEHTIRFLHAIRSKLASLPPKVQEVIKSEFTAIAPSTDLEEYNDDFLAKHKGSVPHAIAAIKMKELVDEDADKVTGEKELAGLVGSSECTFEDAQAILDLLRGSRSKELEGFKKKAAEKWPEVTAFA